MSRPCPVRGLRATGILLLAVAAFVPAGFSQTARIASDFEIKQMEEQAASAHDFASQLSAHLNLGDLRMTRNESSIARVEYRTAAEIAQRERAETRSAGSIERYAAATAYGALAEAKLGHTQRAFEMSEEAVRYGADEARTWNIYASTMHELNQPRKAVSAARNAVTVAGIEASKAPSTSRKIELEIARYSLATNLEESDEVDEARQVLESVIASLRSDTFDTLRKDAARNESFEIYSTVRTDTSAYLSLLNKSQLQLALLYERKGNVARAQQLFRDVLAGRTDDPVALAALARLSSAGDRAHWYAEAFDANPFSIGLVRDYAAWLSSADRQAQITAEARNDVAAGEGAAIRHVLEQMARGENRAARETLDGLAAKFRANDVVQYLAATNDIALGDLRRAAQRPIQLPELRQDIRARLAAAAATAPAFLHSTQTSVAPSTADLRQLLAALQQQRITPEERVALDRITFSSTAAFDAAEGDAKPDQTIFESGTIDGVRFRFSEPIAFAGSYPAGVPLRLTYRVLGATQLAGGDALLLEPVKVEKPQ